MKVILIKNDFGHDLGIVTNANHIVDFLIDNDWLSGATTLYDEDGEEITIKDFCGDDWELYLKNRDLPELRYVFDGVYIFIEYEVYG